MALAAVVENQIRILVADDHEMILAIARMYLDQQGDTSVVTEMDLGGLGCVSRRRAV